MFTSVKNNIAPSRFPEQGKALPWVLCIACLLASAGCAVGPDFVRPPPPAFDRYTLGVQPHTTVIAEGQAQHFKVGESIAADWWRLFKSPKLDAAIKEAVANNPNLQAAQASLRQSQAALQAGYGIFYPQADLGANFSRQKFSSARFGGTTSSIFNLYTLTATVSYTLDVFGGERRTVENLAAQTDFQRYTVLATYLTLSGNIVNAMIARAAYDAQIQATEQLIAIEQEQIQITETQTRAGIVPYVNWINLKTQLAALEATLPPLEQKRSQIDHLLATLTGHSPGELSTTSAVELDDLTLPVDLPVTLPSVLVHQRPDILAAEAQVHAFSANIGVATAALFPSFTLSGNVGQISKNLGDLLLKSSNFWLWGANLAQPLFHGGTLWANRKAAIEAHQQSLANYRQVVLGALQQVADSLRALEHDAEALRAQAQELDSAEEALHLVEVNFQAGLVNYLQILLADVQYHQAKIGYLQALAQRLQDTSALLVALGGGWWNAGEKELSSPASTN